MDSTQKRTLIITAVVGIIMLALIIGIIIALIRFIQGRQAVNIDNQPEATQSVAPENQNLPESSSNTNNQGGSSTGVATKSYQGQGFSLNYPQNWGLLTCNNSANFEFDTSNSKDQKDFSCNYAVKPVTVMVADNLNCQGESVKLGNNNVVRSSEGEKGGEIDYRWCVINPNGADLDITHRVSNSGATAHSKEDHATSVEQMISSISFK